MRLHVRRALGALMLGTILAAMPAVAGFDAGGFGLSAPKAFAKDGKDDRGGKGGGGNGGGKGGGKSGQGGGDRSGNGGGDDGGSRGGGRSGHGGDDDGGSRGGGRSGHGGNDDGGSRGGDDDDGGSRSGPGGGDDDGSDDRGGRGRGGDDDRGDDGGRGRGGDDGRGDDDRRGGGGDRAPAASGGGVRAVKLERSAAGVEVTYSNGVREEIENGRFEQKDASGRTVIERTATAADFARLNANARNSGLAAFPAGAGVPRVEVAGGAIEVSYPTGWREELENGRYELKDPNNNTVVERPATAADIRRLRMLAGG
jgi:hypothetical protein